MVEVESMATQGHISRPGAWSFPGATTAHFRPGSPLTKTEFDLTKRIPRLLASDCLEIGVPGGGSLTWEESKSNLALFAVTSSPLILGVSAACLRNSRGGSSQLI